MGLYGGSSSGGADAVGNQAWEYDTPGSYTWTNPGVDWIKILMCGGGAGGKYQLGGGGGQVVERRVNVKDVPSVSIVIGAGGVGVKNVTQNPGGSTSFGNLVALGGTGAVGGGNVSTSPIGGSSGGAPGGNGASDSSNTGINYCAGYGSRGPGFYAGGGSIGNGGGFSDVIDAVKGGGGGGRNDTVDPSGNGGDGYMLITA